MDRLFRFVSRIHRNDKGQIFILFGAMLTALVGFTAFAVDVGSLVADKRDLQNAADAMALAGAMELPDANGAQSKATEWAEKNGIEADEIESIAVNGQSSQRPNPQIVVTLKRQHDYYLAQVVGVDSTDLVVHASAIKTSPGGSNGVVPWGVLQSEIDSANIGDQVTLKYSAHEGDTGNYGGMAIDDPSGASTYENDIKYGSENTVCSESAYLAGSCVPTGPDCASGYCPCHEGQCPLKTGNMRTPTRTGVEYRLDNTSTSCDTFGEVFTPAGTDTYNIVQQCNPFIEGSLPSLRVLVVPVIDSFPTGGSEDVTIEGFALFFLEGFENGTCASGQDCNIVGRFVRAEVTTGALRGVYDQNSLIQFIQLTE
jgi:Flp pilus assembly protein TadG